ncbi:uncharacterized protein LOC110981741 [Acanthaster planci]|uniref:Uncharacterized protein LOC110981741 n=1 Tax=Acanthaster planci TaxID=133434 RepID=A0A8B7YS12_ACAPL|nr:uncharacterized protein LOC110981741 [Acanthaster planci]
MVYRRGHPAPKKRKEEAEQNANDMHGGKTIHVGLVRNCQDLKIALIIIGATVAYPLNFCPHHKLFILVLVVPASLTSSSKLVAHMDLNNVRRDTTMLRTQQLLTADCKECTD